MKRFFRSIHLYLALAAGLVIITCCFTGATLVFQEELQHAFHHKRYFVKPQAIRLALDQLVQTLKQKKQDIQIVSIRIYSQPDRSVEINYTSKAVKIKNKKIDSAAPQTKSLRPQREQRTIAFVNPYTGELIEVYNNRNDFFYTMLLLHRYLLADDIGKVITGISTLLFLFILITGIILWWPRNKVILKQRLRLKFNRGWKRFNHDYHIVLGFYSAIFLFVFAFTALAWSFEWFNKAIYSVTNSSMKGASVPPKSVAKTSQKQIGLDEIYNTAQSAFQQVKYYNISLPKDSLAPYAVSALSTNAVHETASDIIYIDQFTGIKSGEYLYNQRNTGAKVRATFRPIHTGGIFGLPSKIIAFLVCLLGCFFPVTGVIMWLNRIKRKGTKSVPSEIEVHRA